MNKTENLFVTAMEECAEVQQAISKLLRFGPDGCDPVEPGLSNAKKVMVEFCHLTAMISMLQVAGALSVLDCDEFSKITYEKQMKVMHYMEVSEDAGRVNDGK